jgi:hypothetical protein
MVLPLELFIVMARAVLEQPSVPSALIDHEVARKRVSLRTLQASFAEVMRNSAALLSDSRAADAARKKRIIKCLQIRKEIR